LGGGLVLTLRDGQERLTSTLFFLLAHERRALRRQLQRQRVYFIALLLRELLVRMQTRLRLP
jgi:hypothetical protein